MRIHILHTGKVQIDRALAYKELGLHPAPFTGWFRNSGKKIWVPVSSYLIEHPKGLILVDAGWHEDMRVNQRKHLGSLAFSMFKGELPKGHSVAERLNHLGIKARDLDYVILSHMHSDHVSGIKHVQDAKNILVSEIEWKVAHKKLGYIQSMWKDVPINTFRFTDIPYGPYKRGYDLFGDNSLYIVHTPGHSASLVALMVKMEKSWVVLASDVGYSEKSWTQMILPGITTDRTAAYDSLKWLHNFAKREECVRIICNHDPAIVPEIIR